MLLSSYQALTSSCCHGFVTARPGAIVNDYFCPLPHPGKWIHRAPSSSSFHQYQYYHWRTETTEILMQHCILLSPLVPPSSIRYISTSSPILHMHSTNVTRQPVIRSRSGLAINMYPQWLIYVVSLLAIDSIDEGKKSMSDASTNCVFSYLKLETIIKM